jgi:hypothetical protein
MPGKRKPPCLRITMVVRRRIKSAAPNLLLFQKNNIKTEIVTIPAGSFVSGILRGGISASTGVGTPAEPTPIFIRVTGRGDLPKNFKIDLTRCRIVASGYGQMANERVVARG